MCCYDGTIDSTFGAGTESGVKKYQGKNGLDQDGMAGPATWNCLMSDIQAIQTALKSKGYYRYGSVSGYANDETYNSNKKPSICNEQTIDNWLFFFI